MSIIKTTIYNQSSENISIDQCKVAVPLLTAGTSTADQVGTANPELEYLHVPVLHCHGIPSSHRVCAAILARSQHEMVSLNL
jgi:hypothetical protein